MRALHAKGRPCRATGARLDSLSSWDQTLNGTPTKALCFGERPERLGPRDTSRDTRKL